MATGSGTAQPVAASGPSTSPASNLAVAASVAVQQSPQKPQQFEAPSSAATPTGDHLQSQQVIEQNTPNPRFYDSRPPSSSSSHDQWRSFAIETVWQVALQEGSTGSATARQIVILHELAKELHDEGGNTIIYILFNQYHYV